MKKRFERKVYLEKGRNRVVAGWKIEKREDGGTKKRREGVWKGGEKLWNGALFERSEG